MPLALKIMTNKFDFASRNQRELSAAKEAGYDVKVLSAWISCESENNTMEIIKGVEVHKYSLLPKLFGEKPMKTLMRDILSHPFSIDNYIMIIKKIARRITYKNILYLRWALKIKKFKPDVITCPSIELLMIAYISTLLTRKAERPKLVYDSHEFELGRNVRRSRFAKWRVKHLERFLMKRVAFSIMVNDSIADEVQRIHNLKERPLVVKSTPPFWKIDPDVCTKRRQEFAKLAGVDSSTFFAMYHGALKKDRGIENFILAIQANPNIIGIILGHGYGHNDAVYLEELKRLIALPPRVIFLPAVPNENLWEYVGATDVGVHVIQTNVPNHYLCLPNKFFENIQSLTPLVVADIPEMRKLIDKYDIGLTCDQANIESINSALEKMRTDKELYQKFKHNLVAAKKDLCWENEKISLIEAYKKLVQCT